MNSVPPDVLEIAVDTSLYPLEALFRACYAFTDRCFLFLRRQGPEIIVEFRRRSTDVALDNLVGEFGNELLDQRIRSDLARETARAREWILAQAFVEADLEGPHPLASLAGEVAPEE
jgi:His-Xaa-Ser system protein HxsD